MRDLKNLVIDMKINAYDSVQILLNTISDLAKINRSKNAYYDCFTTDIISGVDALTIQELAKCLDVPISLPNKKHPSPYLRIVFAWGVILVLQSENKN
jgi:hypothetical protein